MVLIDVTLGDALDRLSILDIKLDRIKDSSKLPSIKNSYIELKEKVSGLYTEYDYKIIKYTNNVLFDVVDLAYSATCCLEDHLNIQKFNTMRVNVKRYIDINHDYVKTIEQKSYNKTTGIFVGHHGYGDMILLNGAIRYSSFIVDELYVFCKNEYLENLKLMFYDQPNIRFIPCKDSMVLEVPSDLKFTHQFVCGVYKHNPLPDGYNITKHFYAELNIPIDVMYEFFHIPYEQLEVPEEPYVFVQTVSSSSTKNEIVQWDKNNALTIDPNVNHYDINHKYYEIAEKYVNKPIASYVNILKNAKSLHLIDSCFACMAWVLKLENVKYYDRDTMGTSKIFIN